MNLIESYKRWKKVILSLKKYERRISLIEANLENVLAQQYSEETGVENYKGFLQKKEFSVYSQNGEDGLLLYIFSEIGTTNRTSIEFGIGNGKQCNSANLILNFGWKSLLIEGNSQGVKEAKSFYEKNVKTDNNQVSVVNAFITKDNINQLFEDAGFSGEIDLLSIDIDGNDYWIWQAINVVNPRVVVMEYNASMGPKRSISVEYDPSFNRFEKHKSGWYHGASISALQSLGAEKGYQLIGCDSNGVNAFFVRADIKLNKLQKVSAEQAYYAEQKRIKTHTSEQQFGLIEHLPMSKI